MAYLLCCLSIQDRSLKSEYSNQAQAVMLTKQQEQNNRAQRFVRRTVQNSYKVVMNSTANIQEHY